ncbi:phosphomannomutase CpsG [Salmonella enterica]|nr:phosphomannomutase CpsG [Salmonella enterica]EKY1894580.1 phosphomannomutase CpsG [Salmonella enterica subsp. arizonae serovar 35:z4,z32:-]ELC3720972.1 phosphomannomutase CpsG [Salmonella enterica]ELP5678810.1 phosphomannomutase CpsG [Salmonella enterica]
MNKLTCFKAYDIRGRLGVELDDDIAYRIGRAYGELFTPQTVVVGGDTRLTSESLKKSLSNGLCDAGVNVLDLGMCGTEEIYFSTWHLGVDGGIEVTASHNPIDYNGMKLVTKNARPISSDTGLKDIQTLVELNDFKKINLEKTGNITKYSTRDAYIKHLMGYVNLQSIKKIKIVVNSGNGAAGPVIDDIEEYFLQNNIPVTFVKINNTPDGHFPNGIPNPLLPECREDTSKAVIAHSADFGIAFDGDFDRCFFFDEKGRFIEGYYIVGLLAEVFLEKYPNAKIIHDPRLIWNTIDIVQNHGGKPIMTKTGHAYIKQRMREEDAVYGGEMSAHHYFKDFEYCDSGMIPWILICELLSIRNKSLGELVCNCINAWPASGEINCTLSNPQSEIDKLFVYYKKNALSVDYTDGLSMEFSDWRFNIRCSNTEPVVRLNVESKSNVLLMQEKTREILSFIGKRV